MPVCVYALNVYVCLFVCITTILLHIFFLLMCQLWNYVNSYYSEIYFESFVRYAKPVVYKKWIILNKIEY